MRVPNSEFQPMNAFAPYLVAMHQKDLLAEAEIARRAKLASSARPSVAAWRRGLGAVLAAAARSADPTRANGHVARAA